MRPLVPLLALFVAVACAPSSRAAPQAPSGLATAQRCEPGDQDPYTYRPARLPVLAPCIRVIGTVTQTSVETDGDVHINVRLDGPYRALLAPGNDFEEGAFIIEPVCQIPPLAADAIRVCALDRAPVAPIPTVGQRVWLEGRYVLDLQHHAWAELHPLYRWGSAP